MRRGEEYAVAVGREWGRLWAVGGVAIEYSSIDCDSVSELMTDDCRLLIEKENAWGRRRAQVTDWEGERVRERRTEKENAGYWSEDFGRLLSAEGWGSEKGGKMRVWALWGIFIIYFNIYLIYKKIKKKGVLQIRGSGSGFFLRSGSGPVNFKRIRIRPGSDGSIFCSRSVKTDTDPRIWVGSNTHCHPYLGLASMQMTLIWNVQLKYIKIKKIKK